MAEFIELLKEAELIDFGRNFSIERPALPGDRLLPDMKTQNIAAKYLAMADSAYLPTMATVHALDAEAEIGSRPTASVITVEKLLIKRKINMSERVRLLRDHGVVQNNEILDYIYDDMGRLAEGVKTRTEVAKQELLSSGKITIDENHVDAAIDFGVPPANVGYTFDWSSNTKAKSILDDFQKIKDAASKTGRIIREIETSSTAFNAIAKNEIVQTALFGSASVGRLATQDEVTSLFTRLFGIERITINDLTYNYEKAAGTLTTARYFPQNKISFMATLANGSIGAGLWGVTPEEEAQGAFTAASSDQYITMTQWQTPDPVAIWTKASGMFIPVLPDPNGLFVATVTFPS